MKTPDEIKKGLECCPGQYSASCGKCPYGNDGKDCGRNGVQIMKDALAYIQQLEREREAMLEEMRMAHHCCSFCKHDLLADGCAVTPDPAKRTCFEWRGVCPENTEVK